MGAESIHPLGCFLPECDLWNGTNKSRQHGPHVSEKRWVKRYVDSQRIPIYHEPLQVHEFLN